MIYAAHGTTTYIPLLQATEYPYILCSYYFWKTSDPYDVFDHECSRLLDSGAYSAFSIGVEIKLDKYIEWAQRLQSKSARGLLVTNLDVIAGSKEHRATRKEAQRAIDQSISNADEMRAAGLAVSEVFHIDEPYSYLDQLVERLQPGERLGVSGLGRGWISRDRRREFGDAVFARLRDLCGWDDLIPTHGFGVGPNSMAMRYPLASIDSSGWMQPGRYGAVIGRAGNKIASYDARNRFQPLAYARMERVLEGWKRKGETMARLWEERGVRIRVDNGVLT